MENALKTPVTQLHGVGKVRAAAYERLGIKTVFHLLFHFKIIGCYNK